MIERQRIPLQNGYCYRDLLEAERAGERRADLLKSQTMRTTFWNIHRYIRGQYHPDAGRVITDPSQRTQYIQQQIQIIAPRLEELSENLFFGNQNCFLEALTVFWSELRFNGGMNVTQVTQ